MDVHLRPLTPACAAGRPKGEPHRASLFEFLLKEINEGKRKIFLFK